MTERICMGGKERVRKVGEDEEMGAEQPALYGWTDNGKGSSMSGCA
jgi:hypothetical protein